MKELMLYSSGNEVEFKYENSDEILLYVNSDNPAVLSRDDALELVSFLAHFIVEGMNK